MPGIGLFRLQLWRFTVEEFPPLVTQANALARHAGFHSRLVSTEVVLPDLHNSLLVGTRTN